MLPSSNWLGRHPFTVEIYGFESRRQYKVEALNQKGKVVT